MWKHFLQWFQVLFLPSNLQFVEFVLRRTLDFEVEDQRKEGRLKRTWNEKVEEESVMVGLRRKDAFCRSRWSVGLSLIAAELM